MTSATDLNTKALNAAATALYDSSAGGTSDPILLDMLAATCLKNAETAVCAYLSALPKPSKDAATMAKHLRDPAYCGRKTIHEAAALLEAIDAELRALKEKS